MAAFLRHIPMLARMVERETADGFDLDNAVTIEVATASHRTTRGYAVVAAIWPTKFRSNKPRRTQRLSRHRNPRCATSRYGAVPKRDLLCASSPYAQHGVASWNAYRRHYGPDAADPAILVWKAPHDA